MAKQFPTEQDLSAFQNNVDLAKIEKYLKRFNPIKVMKMEDMEIRHSSILGWLLNPRESHGFGGQFLKDFLGKALQDTMATHSLTVDDIQETDLRAANVLIEKRNIDLFVEFDDLNGKKWAIIIENKFHSRQSKDQLKKYYDAVRKRYHESYEVAGVFLTLKPEKPAFDKYSRLRYKDIVEILDNLISQNKSKPPSEVDIFLTHYLNTLKEKTGMSEVTKEIEKLARELYLKHPTAIDFISSQSGKTRFLDAVEKLFGEYMEERHLVKIKGHGSYYPLERKDDEFVDFIPESWATAYYENDIDNQEYCPLLCWFVIYPNKGTRSADIHLKAWLDWEDKDVPKEAKERMEKDLEKLSNDQIKLTKGKTQRHIFDDNINYINISDMQNVDEICSAITTLLDKFKTTFDEISGLIKKNKEFRSTSK